MLFVIQKDQPTNMFDTASAHNSTMNTFLIMILNDNAAPQNSLKKVRIGHMDVIEILKYIAHRVIPNVVKSTVRQRQIER